MSILFVRMSACLNFSTFLWDVICGRQTKGLYLCISRIILCALVYVHGALYRISFEKLGFLELGVKALAP